MRTIRRPPPAFRVILTALAAAWPGVALAHLVDTGVGPFFDGIAHLVLTPQDLVPVFALTLYVGLCGPPFGWRALLLLPLAWFGGGLVGMQMGDEPMFPYAAFTFLAVGGMMAADPKLSKRLITCLVALLGLLHGVLNGMALKAGPGVWGLLGIAGILFLVVVMVTGVTLAFRPHWTRIVVRVAGGWMVAVGMLMLGWRFAGAV